MNYMRRPNKRPAELALAVSLDVEEEGLFSGRYATRGAPIRNVHCLKRLEPLLRAGLRPTLFCAGSVLADASSRNILARLVHSHPVEIGVHMHHWNTPPCPEATEAVVDNVSASKLSPELLALKLHKVMDLCQRHLAISPQSFRMGRWDLRRSHLPVLAQNGLLCDASVRPLHRGQTADVGPNHMYAPTDPYWIWTGQARIFEVPLTVTPISDALPALLRKSPPHMPQGMRLRMESTLKNWGALTLLPVQHPLWLMKLVTVRHMAAGGRAISLTWHSSEMMPGGAPHMPSGRAVNALLKKIAAYAGWLESRWRVSHLTMTELKNHLGPSAPVAPAGAEGDWTFA